MGWSVSNDNLVRFWLDMWVQGVTGPLFAHTILAIPAEQLEYKVSAYFTSGGEWSWDEFCMYLPSDILLKIVATSPPPPTIPRRLTAFVGCWNPVETSLFGLPIDFYSIICGRLGSGFLQLIWKWQGPHRIRTHLWLTAHERLMTNARRFQLSLTESPVCSECPTHVESLAHVFRDCWRARQDRARGRYFLMWCFQNFGNGGMNVASTSVPRRLMLCRKYCLMFRTLPWRLNTTVQSLPLLLIGAHRLLRLVGQHPGKDGLIWLRMGPPAGTPGQLLQVASSEMSMAGGLWVSVPMSATVRRDTLNYGRSSMGFALLGCLGIPG
ncbi:hypothetical protein K2173_004150 [Erythroxylum novogranatense]|uniref:Reverse transcriptase zinc-binding domain-containing protein n=1 Tax=Erythroxylum novogranatense TaxID=1862640 RepID=A0AAV8SYR6_9ROSI|nr:hypothetical protein K2173_004150 [Erythroxylum novogranatense]